jgi:hypothetical protein
MVASRFPPTARPLRPIATFAQCQVEGKRFHVQGFNEWSERAVEPNRQVVGLQRRPQMYGGAFAEMDRGEQKFKIIDGVLGRFRGGLVTIRKVSPVDRDPVHRKERQDLEGTPGRSARGPQASRGPAEPVFWHRGSRC